MLNSRNNKSKITELVQYIIAIIILLIMVLLVVTCYQVMTENQNDNNASRVSLSYISNKIHAYDQTGKMEIRDGKYGETIVLKDNDSKDKYETRIYNHKGTIYEEYSAADRDMNYANAQVVAKSKIFALEQNKKQIKVETDEGQVIVALRAEVANNAK